MPSANAVETSVVVPAYNEEKGLPVVLEALEQLPLRSSEVIVVDDGSQDGTVEVARRYSCRVISHAHNRGKGAAMRTGIDAALGSKVVFIDADGTYPVASIPAIVDLLDSHDMVVGCRAFEQDNIRAFNRLGNVLVRRILRYLYGSLSGDPLTGLYGVRREFLRRMELESTGFTIETEITIKAARMGLRVANLPVAYHARIGKAKLRPLRDGYRILKMVLGYAPLYAPGVVFVAPGMAISAAGLALLIAATVGGRGALWPAGLAVLTGVQLAMMGMAVKLYAVAHKSTVLNRTAKMLLHGCTKAGMYVSGLGMSGAGVGLLVWHLVTQQGVALGPGATSGVVGLAWLLAALGVELVVSTGFLSLFAKEALQRQGAREVEG